MPEGSGLERTVRKQRIEIMLTVKVEGKQLLDVELKRADREFKIFILKSIRQSMSLPTLLSL